MKKPAGHLTSILAFSLLGFAAVSVPAADAPYKLLKEIPVGGDGGWDLLTVDEANHRLYVSHATKVVVIDTDKDMVVGEITNTPGVHGIAIAPKLNRAFVSNGRSNNVSVVDLRTLQTISTVPTGANPDAMLYEPSQSEVYAFNARGNSATVFAADATNQVIATIELGGNPEFAVADVKNRRVYCNLEHTSEVVAIDTKTHQVVNRWPIAPGEEATGMGFDAAHHRLFLGCANKLMVMMDYRTGKIIASVPIGDGVDANAFDPATQLAFASCRDGSVTIAHEDAPDKLTVVQTLPTARGSRTMALDSKTHKIYLPAAEYEAQPEQPAGATRQRPRMVAGSFKILVFGMGGDNTPKFSHSRDITNPLLPLASLKQDILENKQERVERTVRPEIHKTFQFGRQTIEALAVEDREYTASGELTEATLDYFAQDDDGVVYYLGEDVGVYKDGTVTGHSGAWLLGKDTKIPGVMLPGHPKVGDKFQSENVPGITTESDEIVSVTETVSVPLGTFSNCVKVKEVTADGTEYKFYAPGIGCIKEVEPDGELPLKLHTKI